MAPSGFALKPLRSAAPLSKSRFVHGMQCPLYVWLEVRTDAERAEPDDFTKALFATGDEVGEHARRRWDARLMAAGKAPGALMSDDPLRHEETVKETRAALAAGAEVVHEAAFTYGGVKVRVDVLERLADGSFAIHEVKSTADYDKKKHLLDAAVQLWALRGAGLPVSLVTLVHLNGLYEWPGGEYDLETLFAERDLTAEAEDLLESVGCVVTRLLDVLSCDAAPVVPEDTSCSKPYQCPYGEVCLALGPVVEHPVAELPGRTDAVVRRAKAAGFSSLLELDEAGARSLLTYASGQPNDVWFLTWQATATGRRILLPDLASWIAELPRPVRHLDFETLGAALPMVAHTRPFQVVPLQYSVHTEGDGELVEHREFMADPGDPDPRGTLFTRLLKDLGNEGAIVHWSSYERTVIRKAAADPRYADFRKGLEALLPRLRDLGDAVRLWVFDKQFHGKWSIKKVHPVLVPDSGAVLHDEGSGIVSYDDLEGVARGDVAALMLLEYMRPETPAARRQQIREELLAYCALDTRAEADVLNVLRRSVRGAS